MDGRVTFACFVCNQELAAAEEHRGKTVRCPRCRTEVTVPPALPARPVPPEGGDLVPLEIEQLRQYTGDLETRDTRAVLDFLVPTEIQQLRQLTAGLETHQARALLILLALFITTLTAGSVLFPQFRIAGCFLEAGAMVISVCFIFFVPLSLLAIMLISMIGHRQCSGWQQAPHLARLARLCFWLEGIMLVGGFLVFILSINSVVFHFRYAIVHTIAMVLVLLCGTAWIAAQIVFHFFLQRLALHFGDAGGARRSLGILACWLACLAGAGFLFVLSDRALLQLGEMHSQLTSLGTMGVLLGLMTVYGFLHALLVRLRRLVDGKMR